MSYQPTVWKDRVVEKPRTFDVTNNPDGSITLEPKPGTVLQEGTPVNAANMNKLEQGLAAHTAEEATETELGHIRLSDIAITDSITGDRYKWGMENGIVFLEKVVV